MNICSCINWKSKRFRISGKTTECFYSRNDYCWYRNICAVKRIYAFKANSPYLHLVISESDYMFSLITICVKLFWLNRTFPLFVDLFFSLSSTRLLLDFDYEWHDGCLLRSRNFLHYASTGFTQLFFRAVRIAYLSPFHVVFLFCLFSFSVLYPNVARVSVLSISVSHGFSQNVYWHRENKKIYNTEVYENGLIIFILRYYYKFEINLESHISLYPSPEIIFFYSYISLYFIS